MKFIITVLFPSLIFSQNIVKGKITDKNNSPLNNAIININAVNKKAILSFCMSNSEGNYELKLKTTIDSLIINVSLYGYEKQSKLITNKNQSLNFVLKESIEVLKEFTLSADAIKKMGDTVNYNISSFRGKNDRVIGDVIKNLPGVEVEDDGKIKYQGKEIQKFYVEGMDMLQGKYGTITNNLRADAVSSVQILENHQSLKLLEGIKSSEDPAMNIKLNNTIVTSGNATLGAGFSPLLWDASISPMFFSKSQQLIVSYKANNTGNDASRDNKRFSFGDFFNEGQRTSNDKYDWVNVVNISTPNFSKKIWLNNNLNNISINYLNKLEEDLEFKLDFSYNNDYQKLIGNTSTTIITPSDTISILENKNNNLLLNSLNGKITIENNSKKNYFKNSLEIKKDWNSKAGYINTPSSDITQDISNPFIYLSNDLAFALPIFSSNENIINFSSNITYTETPQSLEVNPGFFENILANQQKYEQMSQYVNLYNFYTNNSAKYIKKIFDFTFDIKGGFEFQKQKLNSSIRIANNNINNDALGDSTKNNLDYKKNSIYSDLGIEYKKDYWLVTLRTPLEFNNIQAKDSYINKERDLSGFSFAPKISISRDIGAYLIARLFVSYNKTLGSSNGIRELYYGYIITNYRSIQRNSQDIPISELEGQNYSFNLMYTNTLKSIFSIFSYTFSKNKSNILLTNNINSNGYFNNNLITRDNYTDNHNFSLNWHRLITSINSSFGFRVNYRFSENDNFINNNLAQMTNNNFSISCNINTKTLEWLEFDYRGTFSLSNNKQDRNSISSVNNNTHSFTLNLYPYQGNTISIETDYYRSDLSKQIQENFFSNIKYRYTFMDNNIDLELYWTNIFGVKNFININDSGYSYTINSFQLRPSQIFASIRFNF